MARFLGVYVQAQVQVGPWAGGFTPAGNNLYRVVQKTQYFHYSETYTIDMYGYQWRIQGVGLIRGLTPTHTLRGFFGLSLLDNSPGPGP